MMVKKPKKLRIGILCDSQKVNNFYFQLAKDIKEHQFVEETFFITGYPTKNNSNDKIVGKSSVLARFNKAFKNFLFSQIKKIIYKVESKYVKANYPDYFGRGDLLQIGIKQIKVEGKLSKNGLFLEFDQKSLLELDSLNFDLILRTGTGILKGNILNIPKYGIISFHHGDNSFLYRGGPCGFWEIYNKSDFTGFIIQKLSSELDGGDVLYRGITLTKPLWMLNKAHIKEKSRPIFMQIIENLSKGIEINKPTSKLYSGPVNRLNNNPFFLLKYILNNYPSFFIKLIRRRIKRCV